MFMMSISDMQRLTMCAPYFHIPRKTILSITYNTKHLLGCSKLQTSIQLHLKGKHELQKSK